MKVLKASIKTNTQFRIHTQHLPRIKRRIESLTIRYRAHDRSTFTQKPMTHTPVSARVTIELSFPDKSEEVKVLGKLTAALSCPLRRPAFYNTALEHERLSARLWFIMSSNIVGWLLLWSRRDRTNPIYKFSTCNRIDSPPVAPLSAAPIVVG